MVKEIKNKFSVLRPNEYFLEKQKSFDDYLNRVKIDPSEKKKIKKELFIKTIKDEVLGLFKLGEIIKKILEWNQKTDREIKEKKKEILLANYFSETEKIGNSVGQLKNFLIDPFGNVIFNKILRILDNAPPDSHLLRYLSNTLIKIVESKNFENLFEKHKYVLSRIEMLSTQALAILYDYEEWPEFEIDGGTGTISVFGKLQSEWVKPFVREYVKQKGISDPDKINRITLSAIEIKNAELINAEVFKKEEPRKHIVRVSPTAGGNEIIFYIEKTG